MLIPTPLKEMEGFSPYAFIGGNLRADGEYGTVYFDNFMVWMQDTDGSGSSGDLSVVLDVYKRQAWADLRLHMKSLKRPCLLKNQA